MSIQNSETNSNERNRSCQDSDLRPFDNGSDTCQTALFEQLFAHLCRGGTWAYYWTVSSATHQEDHPNKKLRGQAKERITHWFPVDAPLPIPPDHGPSGPRHIYFGVHPTTIRRAKPHLGYRAKNEIIEAVNCIYAEIDIKDFAGDWEAVQKYIQQLPLCSSVIIKSGGGYHLYWLLRQPYIIATQEQRTISLSPTERVTIPVQEPTRFARIQGIQRRWVLKFNKLDQNAKDLARVLRVAGTINYKQKYAPDFPKVLFEWANFDLLYELEQFEAIAPPPPPPSPAKPSQNRNFKPQSSPRQSDWPIDEHGRRAGCKYPDFGHDTELAEWLLEFVNPDCGRADWLAIGAALKSLGSAGLSIWDRWSSGGSKYKSGEPENLWHKLTSASFGLLVHIADRLGNIPDAPTWEQLKPPKRQHYYQPTNQELEAQVAHVGAQSARKKHKKRDLASTLNQLLDIYCPSGVSYQWLNIEECAKVVTPMSPKKDEPLTADKLRLLFNNRGSSNKKNKRQVRTKDGKRRKILKSIVTSPIVNGTTRVLAFLTPDWAQTQEALAELGLDSIAYKYPTRLLQVAQFPNGETNHDFRNFLDKKAANGEDYQETGLPNGDTNRSFSNLFDKRALSDDPQQTKLPKGCQNHSFRNSFDKIEDDQQTKLSKGCQNPAFCNPFDKIQNNQQTELPNGCQKGAFCNGFDKREPTDHYQQTKLPKGCQNHAFCNCFDKREQKRSCEEDQETELPKGCQNQAFCNCFDKREGQEETSVPSDGVPRSLEGEEGSIQQVESVKQASEKALNRTDRRGGEEGDPLSKKSNKVQSKISQNQRFWHPFGSDNSGNESFLVMVVLEPHLAEGFVEAIGQALTAQLYPLPFRPIVWPLAIAGLVDPMSPKDIPEIYHAGQTIRTRDWLSGCSQALDQLDQPTLDCLADLWGCLPALPSAKQRAGSDMVTVDSHDSVIRWFNRRFDLHEIIPIDSGQKLVACPWCGDRMIIWPDNQIGAHVARCGCYEGVITPFVARVRRDGLSSEQVIEAIVFENQLGQAKESTTSGGVPLWLASELAEAAAEGLQREENESSSKILAHFDQLEATRQARKAQMLAVSVGEQAFKIKTIIFRDPPGFGKSYMAQEVAAELTESKLRVFISTGTRPQSFDWQARLEALERPAQIYLTVEESCDCFTEAQKGQIMSKGWRIKHAPTCAYVQQRRELLRKDDKIWIFRHNHLQNPQLFAVADLIICDESIVEALVCEQTADFSSVQALLFSMEQSSEADEVRAFVDALWHVCRETNLAIYSQLNWLSIADKIEEHIKSHFNLSLCSALEALEKSPYGQVPKLSSQDGEDGDQTDCQKQDYSDLPRIWLPGFIKSLKLTQNDRAHPTVFLCNDAKKKYEREMVYHWYIKHDLFSNKKMRHKTIIILDASAYRLIYEALFGGQKIEFHRQTTRLSPMCEVMQIKGLNLTRSNLRKNMKPTVSKLAHIANQEGLTFDALLTHKEFKKRIAAEFFIDEEKTLHYRHQRGSNVIKGANCPLIFADHIIPQTAIIRLAHAIFNGDSQPFARYQDGRLFNRQEFGWVAKDKRLATTTCLLQDEENGNQGTLRPRGVIAKSRQRVVYVGNCDLTQFGLTPRIIDARSLNGNSKAVQEAIDHYHDRREREMAAQGASLAAPP